MVFGHKVSLSTMKRVFPDRELVVITMTRNPVDVLVSQFNDYRSHILREVRRGKLYECSDKGFLEWYQNEKINNALVVAYSRLLLNCPPKDVGKKLQEIDYVMHTPTLNQDMKWLAKELDIPEDFEPRNSAQFNLGQYAENVYRIQPEIRQDFLEKGKVGQQLYMLMMKRRNEILEA